MSQIFITPGRVWVQGETVTAAKMNDFLQNAFFDSDDVTPTGVMLETFENTTASSGYVFMVGRTLGNAASGGTERANADAEDLFEFLWNSLADAEAPVSTGRGGSAQADFDANKTITIPNRQGTTGLGKDNGVTGVSANVVTDANADIMGKKFGAETVASNVTIPSQEYNIDVVGGSGFDGFVNDGADGQVGYKGAPATISNNPTSVIQPSLTVNYIIKL